MLIGESNLQIETGMFRPIWTPVSITSELKVDVPSLQYQSNSFLRIHQGIF